MADALPDAVYQIVPGAEHMAFERNPDFVIDRINAYLDRLGAE